MKKRVIAAMLALVMVLLMLPMTAFATGRVPTGLRWYVGEDTAGAEWDWPRDAGIVSCDTVIYYSASRDGERTHHDDWYDNDKGNGMSLQNVSPGYYWFKVRYKFEDGSYSDWVECTEPYLYAFDPSTMIKKDAPTDLLFDRILGSENPWEGTFSWNTNGAENTSYTASLYYMGADGKGEPQLIDSYTTNSGSMNVNALVELQDMKTGVYGLAVSAASMYNYVKEYPSDPVWIENAFSYTAPDPLPTPVDLSWVNKIISWTIDPSVREYELEFMHSVSAIADPVADWHTDYETSVYNGEYTETEMEAQLYSRTKDVMQDYGSGWYYFRVRAIPGYSEDGELTALKSEWAYCTMGQEVAPEAIGTPTELEWHRGFDYYVDNNPVPEYGYASWLKVENADHYTVMLFRKTGDFPEVVCEKTTYSAYGSTDYRFIDLSAYITESGDYFYTVLAHGDGIHYGNGEAANSKVWTYTKPTDVLTVSDPVWDGLTTKWNEDGLNKSLVDHYEVEIYWTADEYLAKYYANINNLMHVTNRHCQEYEALTSFDLARYGEGYYLFRVRAISNDMTQALSGDWTGLSAPMEYEKPKQQMPAPTGLIWNYRYNYDGSTSYYPGAASFCGQPNTSYEICYYRVINGMDRPYFTQNVQLWEDEEYHMESPVEMMLDAFETGSYCFTVKALGDGVNATDSAEVRSEVWNYVRPDVTLTVSDPVWDDDSFTMLWTNGFTDDSALSKYRVQVYHGTENDASKATRVLSQAVDPDDLPFEMPADVLAENGTGYYFFRVMTNTSDVTKALPCSYTERSAGKLYTPPSEKLSVSDACWDINADGDCVLTWKNGDAEQGSLVASYLYEVSFSETADGEKEYVFEDSVSREELEEEGWPYLRSWVFEEYGEGYYSFRVKAVSADPFTIDSSDWAECSEPFAYVPPPALAAPTDLEWGDNGEIIFRGIIGEEYYVGVYDVTDGQEDAPEIFGTWARVRSDKPVCIEDLMIDPDVNLQSGSYQFAVHAEGDFITSSNSETVWSEIWEYTRPEIELDVTDAYIDFDSMTIGWEIDAALEKYVDHYEVQFYTYDERGVWECWYWYTFEPDEELYEFPFEMLTDYGENSYAIRVWAIPKSIEKAAVGSVAMSPTVRYDMPDQKLSAPTDLQWNTERWEDDSVGIQSYGCISFKRSEIDQNLYEIELYEVGEDECLDWVEYEIDSDDTSVYITENYFQWDIPDYGSGTYYFRVRARGDYTEYGHSDWVTSDTWTYTAPAEKIAAITGLDWDVEGEEIWAIWNCPEDLSYVGGYEKAIYYSETENGEKDTILRSSGSDAESNRYRLRDWVIEEFGSGWYWFEVRAKSADITKYNHGDWSALSAPYHFVRDEDIVNDALQDAIDELPDDPTDEEVAEAVEAVKAIDPDKLISAMQKEESNTTNLIKQLEKVAGMTAAVEVDNEAAELFEAESISVIGAGLNAAAESDGVTLAIGPAERESGINETLYNNAVEFSMKLEGAADADAAAGQQLAVPVQITLPVPAKINPAFLVVLHRHADGSYEELRPNVYERKGQWYASFVTTGFSDFALASVQINAEVFAGMLEVNVAFAMDLDAMAICAAYDAEGRQLGSEFLDYVSAGTECIELIGDYSKAATVKLFLLDDATAPMFEAASCTITSKIA